MSSPVWQGGARYLFLGTFSVLICVLLAGYIGLEVQGFEKIALLWRARGSELSGGSGSVPFLQRVHPRWCGVCLQFLMFPQVFQGGVPEAVFRLFQQLLHDAGEVGQQIHWGRAGVVSGLVEHVVDQADRELVQ